MTRASSVVNCQSTLARVRFLAACPTATSEGVDGIDAAIEALADHDVEFDLGDVQPAAVLGGMDELEAIPERLGTCIVFMATEPLAARPGAGMPC